MTMSMKCAIYARDILYGSPEDEAKKFSFLFITFIVSTKSKILNFLCLSPISLTALPVSMYTLYYIYMQIVILKF